MIKSKLQLDQRGVRLFSLQARAKWGLTKFDVTVIYYADK